MLLADSNVNIQVFESDWEREREWLKGFWYLIHRIDDLCHKSSSQKEDNNLKGEKYNAGMKHQIKKFSEKFKQDEEEKKEKIGEKAWESMERCKIEIGHGNAIY